MRIIKTKDYAELSREAFKVIKETLEKYEDPVINTTTGASTRHLELLVEAINPVS